eukprot:1852574-Prymnesium_polylepis.1
MHSFARKSGRTARTGPPGSTVEHYAVGSRDGNTTRLRRLLLQFGSGAVIWCSTDHRPRGTVDLEPGSASRTLRSSQRLANA